MEKSNIFASFCYIGFLFVIPLFFKKDDFLKFHLKQGIGIFLGEIICILIGLVPFLGWVIALIGWIFWIFASIWGIINMTKGRKKMVPFVGELFREKIKLS